VFSPDEPNPLLVPKPYDHDTPPSFDMSTHEGAKECAIWAATRMSKVYTYPTVTIEVLHGSTIVVMKSEPTHSQKVRFCDKWGHHKTPIVISGDDRRDVWVACAECKTNEEVHSAATWMLQLVHL
jgi:hypothetical protein